MKHTIHTPTEQYGYVETEIESAEEVIEHQKIVSMVKGEKELDTKRFNGAIDEYLKTGTVVGGTELYAEMSREQQMVFQEVKKSLKRIGTITN